MTPVTLRPGLGNIKYCMSEGGAHTKNIPSYPIAVVFPSYT